METLKIDIQNEQEKKILIAFLDSLSYQYRTKSDDYTLTDEERPWNQIKQKYQGF